MFLKELYEAIGIELEVRNLLIDYKLNGKCMYIPLQVVGGISGSYRRYDNRSRKG